MKRRWAVVYRDVNGRTLDRSTYVFRRSAAGVAGLLNDNASAVADDMKRAFPGIELPADQIFTATVERNA